MPDIQVYEPEVVSELKRHYGSLLYQSEKEALPIKDHLSAILQLFYEGIQEKKGCLLTEMQNNHPGFAGRSPEELRAYSFSREDCCLALAREYGFENWEAIPEVSYEPRFEQAVGVFLAGDYEGLNELIEEDPSLVRKRSPYGHRATLLHYGAANGVELWRQQVPSNLPVLVQLLLKKGANPKETMPIYGGNYDTLSLTETSAHPFEAGVGTDLVALLRG